MSVFSRFALAAIALSIVAYPTGSLNAAKPITGVSCGGGFFVKLRNNDIFWIHRERRQKTSVHTNGSAIFAMAECGDGVLTVFSGGADGDRRYEAYHSSDCLSIGTVGENTVVIHSGRLPITRIVPDRSGVSLWLADNSVVRSNSCRLRKP